MAENRQSTLKFRKSVNSTKITPLQFDGTRSPTVGCYDETPVYCALRSLGISLYIGGLAFKKYYSKQGIKRHLTVSHFYSYIVLVFLTVNVLRWLTMFRGDESFGIHLFMKIIVCTWSVETLLQYMAFVRASEFYGRLPKFFVEWEKIRSSCRQCLNSISRLSNVCSAILWTVVSFNCGFTIYLVFYTDMQNMTLTPWGENFDYVFVIKIVNIILQFYLTMGWVASSTFMFTICKTLAYEFQQINCSVKKFSTADPSTLMTGFERIRQNHQKLCNLVANADNIFSPQIACSLSGSMLIACLMVYILIDDDTAYPDRDLVFIIEVFWTSVPFGKVVMDCVSGAILNAAVNVTFVD